MNANDLLAYSLILTAHYSRSADKYLVTHEWAALGLSRHSRTDEYCNEGVTSERCEH